MESWIGVRGMEGLAGKLRCFICFLMLMNSFEQVTDSPGEWHHPANNLALCLNCKEIQPVHPKGDQSWVFIGRTDAKAETPVPWPPHAKS